MIPIRLHKTKRLDAEYETTDQSTSRDTDRVICSYQTIPSSGKISPTTNAKVSIASRWRPNLWRKRA